MDIKRIEKLARALCEKAGFDPDRCVNVYPRTGNWPYRGPWIRRWEQFKGKARDYVVMEEAGRRISPASKTTP